MVGRCAGEQQDRLGGGTMDSPPGDAGTSDTGSDGSGRGCLIADAGSVDGGPMRGPSCACLGFDGGRQGSCQCDGDGGALFVTCSYP